MRAKLRRRAIFIKKKCYIIGAYCSDENRPISKKEDDIIIAADGGFDVLQKNSVRADVLIGDFDSIEKIPDHENIIRHPVEKDDTDTFLAYKTAYKMGYRNFIIYGGIGGRIDHTMANLQTLVNIAQNGGRGFLVGENCIITAISNGNISFSENQSGIISIFSLEKACGVNIEGLKYCAQDLTITPDYPIGVSNSFTGKKATISVDSGSLLIFWYDSAENFEKYSEKLFI